MSQIAVDCYMPADRHVRGP